MSRKPCTALIVDDSPEDRELYRRYLLRDPNYAYTFLEASLGHQGLVFWQQQPDVVLLDYRLPDLDGLEFLAQLQSSLQSSTQPMCLPVIVITGQGNEAIAVQAIKAGAQDYLVKEQITPEGLQLAVHGAIATVQLHTQLQQRIDREHVVAHITQQIHQSLNLDDILQTTVAEVRHFLHTDRVLVLRLEPDGNGTVIAESVGAAWRSLLSSSIYDPCLAANYLRFSRPGSATHDFTFVEDYVKRYRQGQVTAIENIYNGNIDLCHVELLAQFQVQANLVVPILHDDQFWGLLIAHHCTAPHPWQPLEIDLLKELTTQVSIALRQAELYQQAQRELAERQQAEAELRESEARFRQLAENIDAVFWMKEMPTNQVSYVSSAYERLWGLNPQELYDDQQIWIDHIHPEDRESAERAFQEKAAAGQFDQEYRIVLADGSIRWVRDRCFPLRDQTGEIYRFTGIAEDITAAKHDEDVRQQAKQALQERERQLTTLAEASPAAIFRCDTASNCIYVNRRWCEMTGQPAETALGMGWIQTLHVDDRDRLTETWLNWGANAEAQGFYQREARCIRPDGRVIWFICQALPEINPDGAVVGYIGTLTDVTEQKQAEAALRQSEERYRSLAELIPQLVWTANGDGVLLDINQRWSKFTGLTLEQARTTDWEPIVHPDDVPGLFQQWAEAVQQGTSYQAEGRMRRADGVYRWHLHQAFPERNEHGHIVKWFGTATDIELQKRLEVERDRLLQLEQTARLDAERANRIKDEFLVILSHELRSPLNPILGWTQLLQTRKFDEAKTAEALATIERNAKLQTQLIDDLLDMSKILRGKFSMNAAPVNLVFIIEAAMDTVRTAAVAKSILLHPVLSKIGQVHGDATRLQQIVWNLLSNAIKFTPRGGRIDIRLEQVEHQESEIGRGELAEGNWELPNYSPPAAPHPPSIHSYAQITVTDTGKGVSPDFLPHIFELFRQEDTSITRKYGGLGLGLAIVRHLVEAHGGTITADSKGEGRERLLPSDCPC